MLVCSASVCAVVACVRCFALWSAVIALADVLCGVGVVFSDVGCC